MMQSEPRSEERRRSTKSITMTPNLPKSISRFSSFFSLIVVGFSFVTVCSKISGKSSLNKWIYQKLSISKPFYGHSIRAVKFLRELLRFNAILIVQFSVSKIGPVCELAEAMVSCFSNYFLKFCAN